MPFAVGAFYKSVTVLPANPCVSEDEDLNEDDNVMDPDYLPLHDDHGASTSASPVGPPPAKRKCTRPAMVLQEDLSPEEDEEEEVDDPKQKKKNRKKKGTPRVTKRTKVDINNPPLPPYHHVAPGYVKSAYEYFMNFFTPQIIKHITYQTNLYATQKDVTTSFTTTEDEITKIVTVLSTDLGVEPMSTCQRYDSDTRKKEDVPCPSVIKGYNENMGGIDKSDMLVHLYKTPMKAKRWYMRLFAYIIDLCLINSWLVYRRDCKSLGEAGMPLKDFRIEVFWASSRKKPTLFHSPRAVAASSSSYQDLELPKPVRGHRTHIPDPGVRFDKTQGHMPVVVARQTCKFCSKQGNIVRSHILYKVCKVHLCLNDKRNCFSEYHERIA